MGLYLQKFEMEDEYNDQENLDANDSTENKYIESMPNTISQVNQNALSNSESGNELKHANTSNEEANRQIQQTLHNQTNEIATLKKDLTYWKNKSAKLNIDFRSAQYDWNKAKNIKSSILQESKDLKDKVLELENKIKELEATIASEKEAADKLREEKEQNAKEVETKEPINIEQDIINKAWTITDTNTLMRLIASMNSLCQQRYFANTINASKSADPNGAAAGNNETPFGHGMFYFPGPMMNSMNMMPMNTLDPNFQQTNASKSTSSTK